MNLDSVLSQFENTINDFTDFDVVSALWDCSNETKETIEHQSEVIAMSLIEAYTADDDIFCGKFYFGPYMTLREDGTGLPIEYPDRRQLTHSNIQYWKDRIRLTNNPYLRVRYAGLVWDFEHHVTQHTSNFEICTQYINDLIVCASDSRKRSSTRVNFIKRAIHLSVKMRQAGKLNDAKDVLNTMIAKCNDIEDKIMWSSAFAISQEIPNSFTYDEQKSLVILVEEKFDIIYKLNTDSKQSNPWLLMDVAEMLAPFYNKYPNEYANKLNEIFEKVERAYDIAGDNMASIQLEANYHQLHNILSRYKLSEQAKRIRIKIANCSKRLSDELGTYSYKTTIPKELIDNCINSTLCNEDIEQSFANIACKYIPRKEREIETLKNIARKTPLRYHITNILYDERGRSRYIIDSIDCDLKGHLAMHISISMNIDSIFLGIVINKAVERGILTKDNIIKYIYKSPVFNEQKIIFIEKGLDAYFAQDYIVAIHLLIPQIEDAIRELADINGICILRSDNSGKCYQLRTLDALLRDSQIERFITPNIAYYFRILYTDNRGWNLRNDVCHGMSLPNKFNRITADRVLHSILCLGLLRFQR